MKTYVVDKKECDSEAVEYSPCFAFFIFIFFNRTWHVEKQGSVQKGSSSPALSHEEGKAAAVWASGAYEGVREHDHAARTPLATFFNTPLGKGSIQGKHLPQLVKQFLPALPGVGRQEKRVLLHAQTLPQFT